MNKREKAKAMAMAYVNTAKAMVEVLQKEGVDIESRLLQAECIKRCGFEQVKVIAQQPLPRFKNGGVVPSSSGGETITVNIDSTLSPKQQKELYEMICK